MSATFNERLRDPARWRELADWLAVALVASLPWSTSATGILSALWLIAVIPGLDIAQLRREVMSPAGGLPVLLWLFGLVGMLWTDVSWAERIGGLNSFHKLLFIPLLFANVRGSERGATLLLAFLGSCAVLLALSWFLFAFPGFVWRGGAIPAVPVKNYASQSDLFIVCIFALADLSLRAWQDGRRRAAAGLALLAIVFFANIAVIATTRTSLVELPILALLFGCRRLGWRGIAILVVACAVLGAAAWQSSSFLRFRVTSFAAEVQSYESSNATTPAGERLEFWRKSIAFIKAAPVFGHGTGSIRQQFAEAAGPTGVSKIVATNPHNQTFAVAIQLGLLGAAVLFAMWIAHAVLFSTAGPAAWIGLVIVVQNVVGSLFNSQLFDFTQGWGYALGVGIAGGIVLKNPAMTAPFTLPARPSILVITLRRLGDVLLTTPLMRSLRRGYPDATLDALVFRDTAAMLKGNPDIDNLRTVPDKASVIETVRAIGLRRYDLVVTTQTGDRLVFAALMAARRRVGLVPRNGGWWKRHVFVVPVVVDPDAHRIDELNRLIVALGLEPTRDMVSPRGIETQAVAPADRYAVLHPTPAHGCKRWNVQGWRDLARALAARGLTVVSTQGPAPAEATYVDGIWADVDTPIIRERARLDWAGLAALLRGAAVYVGPDTSMTHLAAANGCPTVVLFGPTRPRLIGPWPLGGLSEPWADRGTVQRRGNAWVVQHPMPCQPCDQLGCDRHENSRAQCLDDLTAAEVLVAVDQALAGAGGAQAKRPL